MSESIERIIESLFVFESLRTHRIYQICGAKDVTVALGVQAKEQVILPNVESDPTDPAADIEMPFDVQPSSRIAKDMKTKIAKAAKRKAGGDIPLNNVDVEDISIMDISGDKPAFDKKTE
eukprot:70254_1